MSNINQQTQSDFFGRDGMVPFIGVVEDVNDPKASGRVKVRCVGWHPKQKKGGDETGEDGLKTEDLPWARVGMPTTHAQQSRIGGKHGLLPGTWVMGFFLDGQEAQDPFVLSTFNFTAKASEQDYRELPEGQDGTFSQADKPFDKNEVSPKTQPNIDTRTPKETEQKGYSDPNDPSGDIVNDDSDSECAGKAARASTASTRRQKDPMKVGENGNAEGQRYEVANADGLCGTIAHARDDIQRRLKERMPSKFSRIVYNDAVWNRFTGSHMDMNGIMAQLAYEMSQTMKAPAQSTKAFTERTVNRTKKASTLKGTHDRDGNLRKEADEKDTEKGDEFHAKFAETVIDAMQGKMFDMLKVINQGGDNEEITGPDSYNSTSNTTITNFEALCIADTILNNTQTFIDDIIQELLDLIFGGGGFEIGEDLNEITSIIGSLSDVMQFPLLQKYGNLTKVFNRAGSRSQDEMTKKEGCASERVYNIEQGPLGSLAGFGAGSGAGGSGLGSRLNETNPGVIDWTNVGFGGANPGNQTGSTISIPCGGSLEILIPWIQDLIDGDPFDPEGFDQDDWRFGYGHNGPRIVGRNYDRPTFPIDWTKLKFKPAGYGARIIPRSLPSSDPNQAENFSLGLPNTLVVRSPGTNYYFGNVLEPSKVFPSIYIPGYNGTPVPVIDRVSGEFVAVLTNANSWSAKNVTPTATVIPDDNDVGIMTDDPDYDIRLSAMFIENTGFAYENPEFVVIDKDTGRENGKVKATLQEGRLVELEVIEAGTNFRRIPEVRLKNSNQDPGYGCRVRPIMDVVPRDQAKLPQGIDVVYCPAKNQLNYTAD